MPYGLFDYGGTINTMGAAWQAPQKCKTMFVNCNVQKSECCPPGTFGYTGVDKSPVQYIICEDGYNTRTPVGAQTLVDPCRGHYKCPSTISQPYQGKSCNYRLV